MKLSRASSYALHAVVHLAGHPTNQPLPSHFVARARGIPERFLLKVLKPLVSARLLTSVKGPNGGYRLARPSKNISMLDVIQAVEGPIRGVVPEVDGKEGSMDRRLEEICTQAAEDVRKQLQKVKIADLAEPVKGRPGKRSA
jgi:Rrf2 family protein